MVDRAALADWVERYVAAWNSNEPDEVAALFTPDGRYQTEPFADPWVGREAIVAGWLEAKDEPGDTSFDYEVLVTAPELGIVKGTTRYRSTGKVYANLWEIQLAPDGAANSFVEWWMEDKSATS